MSELRQYKVTYKSANGGGEYILFAKNRDDAIEFTKRQVKIPLKIKSAAQINKEKSKGGRPKKVKDAIPVVAPVATILSPEEAFDKMLAAAHKRMTAAPFSGLAIGNYLGLILKDDPTSDRLAMAVHEVVRVVNNYDEKLAKNKRL